MNPCFDLALAKQYKSKSQQIRVMSEAWVQVNIACPACGGALRCYDNNHPAADFYCKQCPEQFELKSSGRKWGKKIVGGSYAAVVKRLKAPPLPNFFFLHYKGTHSGRRVENFFCLPTPFFTADIIEKRPPLAETAGRSGWVGCKILLDKLPESGKIFYKRDNICASQADIQRAFAKICFLNEQQTDAKAWLIGVMQHIDLLAKGRFTLAEFYAQAEAALQKQHPDNKNIRAKMRQQLQILRDKGYLSFEDNKGAYALC